MKITSKSDYAMIIMVELAKLKKDQIVSLGKIADKFHLSLSYIEQLACSLRKARLIDSKQGVNGGYLLAKPAKKIYISEIIKAVGDEIQSVDCLNKDCNCQKVAYCNAKKPWQLINASISTTFKKINLAELINA